jgi:PAS domain S-box-containing protein
VVEPEEARALVAETLLGDAAEHAQMGIFVYDDQGKYVAVNEYAAALLGYERAELLAHDVGDFTEGGIDRTVLRQPHRREGVRIVHRKDGSTVATAFVVTATQVSRFAFYVAFVWELEPGDPRAADAT